MIGVKIFEFCLAAILATGCSSRRTVFTVYIGFSTLMWDGVHTIIFVVATFAAGHPNRWMS